ncbi:MAG: hypothetical protein ACTSVV_04170 [Promethearchaeota archaeon]
MKERSKLVSKDDFREAMERMDKRFEMLIEQMNKGFEEARKDRELILIEMDKRLEEARKEREQIRKEMDERFKALIEQMNKGFEEARKAREQIILEMNKRFEEARKAREQIILEMNKRFEEARKAREQIILEMNKRFEEARKEREQIRKEMDERFEAVNRRLDFHDENFKTIINALNDIQKQIGKPFEQFARNVVIRILKGEGFEGVRLKPAKFEDKDYTVFEDTSDVQIDGYSEEPAVIVEITSILRKMKKVDDFLRKKEFIEKLKNKKFRGFFVAASCEMDQEEVAEVIVKLREHNCELINL